MPLGGNPDAASPDPGNLAWARRRYGLLLLGLVALALLGYALHQTAISKAQRYALAHGRYEEQGLRRLLYDNPFLTGPYQEAVRPVPRLHTDRRVTPPLRAYPASWRWQGLLRVPASGRYVLVVYAAEAVRLRLDGRRVIEDWIACAPRELMASLYLEAGPHLLDLSNVQETQRLDLSLGWIAPGGRQEIIPNRLMHPLDNQASDADLYALNRAVERGRFLIWLLPLAWWGLWLLVLRDPARAWRALRAHVWFLPILALAGVGRLIWLERVPGLCGESAHFMWRAGLILEGALPFEGMNQRVGPIFEYLLAPLAAVLGPSVELLRGAGAVLNLLALVFCYRVFSREAGRTSALWASLFVAVLPPLVMYAREPVETLALSPLFMFLGLDLLSLSRRRAWLAVPAGILWGLAAFNHPIFQIVPFSLGISALVVSRLRVLRYWQTYGLGLGYVLGYLPRVLDRLIMKPSDPMGFTDPWRLSFLGRYLRSFVESLDGEVVYRTFTGGYAWDTHLIIPWAMALGGLFLLWGLWRHRDRFSWIELFLGLALAIHLLMVPLGAPTAQPRYFIFCQFWAALLLGRAAGRAWQWVYLTWRPVVLAGLLALAGFCAASVGINYFQAHLATGGRPYQWDDCLMDFTSDAWMDHGALARELIKRGYPVVATADFWHHTLDLSLNLYQGRPLRFMAVPFASLSNTERAAVFYNSPEGELRMREFLAGHRGKKFEQVELPEPLRQQYILLERKNPPVGFARDLVEAR